MTSNSCCWKIEAAQFPILSPSDLIFHLVLGEIFKKESVFYGWSMGVMVKKLSITCIYLNMKGNDQPVIRDEELFTSDENTSLNYFYASNQILPKPLILGEFFKEFQ